MRNFKRISIISEKSLGRKQTLKDYLTTREKQIILHLLNSGLTSGKVRNKIYQIEKTGNNMANVKVFSEETNWPFPKKVIRTNSVRIKYS